MTEMKIEDFVDMASFDHNLVVAQMWEVSTAIPFECNDDLDPDVVRIALDCGHSILSMNSLDRLIERHPDYKFHEFMPFYLARKSTPSKKLIEHVMRTTPENANGFLVNNGVVVELGFDIVIPIVASSIPHIIDELHLFNRVRGEKVKIINRMLEREEYEHLRKIVSNPRWLGEVVDIIRGNIEDLGGMVIRFIKSPHSSVEFLEELVKVCGDDDVGFAAQCVLMGRQNSE